MATNAFDSRKSTTFSSSNRPWQVTWGTGVGVSVSQTEWCSGVIAQDTVTIAGLTVPKQSMGLINKQSRTLFEWTGLEGIIGMGFKGSSAVGGRAFFQTLIDNKQLDPIFSLFLTPKSIGGAQLTLGGVDSTKYTGRINYVPIDGRRGSWNITRGFQSITVNGKPSNVVVRSAIADSGTSNMVAPVRDARAIYAMISPSIILLDPKGAWAIPCSELPNLNATITITMGGIGYTIPSKEFSVGPFPGKPGMCQTLINSPTIAPFWIIGGSLLKYYYTVWDMGNTKLGWATTAHSPAR
jgi:hypothetical protein